MLNEFEFNAKESLDSLMVTEKSEAAVLEKDVAAALTTFLPWSCQRRRRWKEKRPICGPKKKKSKPFGSSD